MITCYVCRGTGVNPASDNSSPLPCDTCHGKPNRQPLIPNCYDPYTCDYCSQPATIRSAGVKRCDYHMRWRLSDV